MNAVAAKQPDALRRWIRPPQQARTRKSLSRLLDAAESLVAEQGFDETSIAEIARRAQSSVGGFYRRFRDKEGLLHALHERFCEEAEATADDALNPVRWQGASASQIIEAFIAFIVDIYREKRGLLLVFFVRAALDETVRERTEGFIAYLTEGVAALLGERRIELGHPDPATAASFGLRVILGTLTSSIQLQSKDFGLDDPRLSGELARVFNSYLCVRSGAPA